MYRQYLKSSVETEKLKEINRNAPSGVKYCNFVCQDFRKKSNFSGVHALCNDCRNMLNIAEKQVNEKVITIEQFKENPGIINGKTKIYNTYKTCITCKQKKTGNNFNSKKSSCKACILIKNTNRNNEGLETLISDIENIKNNSTELEKFVTDIPKDKLIKLISHFKIGRKATDKKNTMVLNIVKHFKSLLNPLLCKGGCGATLPNEFEICKSCEKSKPKASVKKEEFEENIDEIVEQLKPITPDLVWKYNRDQCYTIARKLGLKVPQKTKKDTVIRLINEALGKREEEKKKPAVLQTVENIVKNQGYELEIKGTIIPARERDKYINATMMCKAGGKKFNHWYSQTSTKEFIKNLKNVILEEKMKTEKNDPENSVSEITQENTIKLVDIKKGGDVKKQGSWVHPDLAIHLAQWICPMFALQVIRWVREIFITGTVTDLYQVKTDKELEDLEKTQMQIKINELENKNQETEKKYKELENNHKKVLYKRQYYKFHKGACFYVVQNEKEYKAGFDGIDINERLRSYRTLKPTLKVRYLVFSENAKLIEDSVLTRFKIKKQEPNHEVLINVELHDIAESVKTIANFLNFEIAVTTEEELETYNDS